MNATVKRELYRVNLTITDGPSIRDVFGDKAHQITGICVTYTDSKPTAIHVEAETNPDLFVDLADMDKPESWPAWLRELVEEYRPAA